MHSALASALDGDGPLLPPGGVEPALLRHVPPGAALVLGTSGSTSGSPRLVALTAEAVRASAGATHEALGGGGSWLLTLPADHVAGIMVAARALLAGGHLTTATPGPFRPQTFADDVARHRAAAGGRSYTSLVPTQLRRVIDDPSATAAAATFDAVLVGGAATPPSLLDRARAAGVRVVTTYGMTETSGGCVYDGVPLRGVGVRIDDGGRIVLSGPTLALGYVTAAGYEPIGAELTTADRGRWDGRRLQVLGRADDVVVTGGVNVDPAQVQAVLAAVPGVAEAAVVGVPDPEWGEAVAAALVPTDRAALSPGTLAEAVEAEARAAVRAALGGAWVPRRVAIVAELPLRGPGKPDRVALRQLLGSDDPGDGPGGDGAG